MSEQSFRVTPQTGTSEGVQILDLDGAITFSTSAIFQEAMAKTSAPRVILDLTDVPSLDSMAIGALVRAFVTCNKAGRKLALVGLTRRVHNILQLTGVDPLFDTFATVADAEQSLR